MEIGNKPIKERDLSCTFCGPGTWAVWEVLTEDGVFFVCELHHVQMCKADLVLRERRMGKVSWSIYEEIKDYE